MDLSTSAAFTSGSPGKHCFLGVIFTLNINHPFFKPYTNNEDFKIVLERFVISFVVAEQQAKSTSNKEGYIPASAIRHRMNEFLSKVSED